MPEKRSKEVRTVTSIIIEMHRAICVLAGERGWSETRARWLERAAARAGIPFRTASALFYREMGNPRAAIVERVRQALLQHQKNTKVLARNEYEELCERLDEMERKLARMDTNAAR